MGERSKDVALTTKVKTRSQVQLGALPEGQQGVGRGIPLVDLDAHAVNGDSVEGKVLSWHIRVQAVLVATEHLVNERVPPVEDGITHGGGDIPHHSVLLQVTVVGIVRVRNDVVPHVVETAVQLQVGSQVGRLNHVPENVDSTDLIQRNLLSVGLGMYNRN